MLALDCVVGAPPMAPPLAPLRGHRAFACGALPGHGMTRRQAWTARRSCTHQWRCQDGRAGLIKAEAGGELIQLATAKLPEDVDIGTFSSKLYQWASTMTSSGQNLPFTLPFRTNPLSNGFELSLLRIGRDGYPVSVGDLTATVEEVQGEGTVLFVRFGEGEASGMDRRTPLPTDPKARVRLALDALVDVPLIMNTLPGAIRAAASQARGTGELG